MSPRSGRASGSALRVLAVVLLVVAGAACTGGRAARPGTGDRGADSPGATTRPWAVGIPPSAPPTAGSFRGLPRIPSGRSSDVLAADALWVWTGHGRDDAPGTRDQPLATVRAATDRVTDGGTVVVRSGIYRESLGALRRRVTIRSAPGEQVWFKGTAAVGDWRPRDGLWVREHWDPPLCRRCVLPAAIDPAHPLAGQPDLMFRDGRPLRPVRSLPEVGPGTFYYDRISHELTVGNDPAGHLVEATSRERLLQFEGPGAAGSELLGVGVTGYGSRSDYSRRFAMVIANAPGVRLVDDVFSGSASAGAAVTAPDGEVSGSAFVDNGMVGLQANKAHGLQVRGSTFTGNNAARFAVRGPAVGAAGMKVAHTADLRVADDLFVANHGNGFWCDLGCTGATVVRSTARANQGHGFYYEVSSRALFASDVSVGNRRLGIKVSSSDHVRLVHNTVVENTGGGIGVYVDPRTPDADPYSARLGLSWLSRSVELSGNLVVARAGQRGPLLLTADYRKNPVLDAASMVTAAEGDLWVRRRPGSPRALVSWWLGRGRITLFADVPSWRRATGREATGGTAVLGVAPGAPDAGTAAAGSYPLRGGVLAGRAGVPLPADVAAVLGVPAAAAPPVGALPGSG